MKLFYSENEIAELTGLSRPTVWRMKKRGEFPQSVKISQGRIAYPADAIHEWAESLRSNTERVA